MKPYERQTLDSKVVTTLAELNAALQKLAFAANQDADVVYIRGPYGNPLKLSLEAECLSDGSVVYQIYAEESGGGD